MLRRQIRQAEPVGVEQPDTQPTDGAMTSAKGDDVAADDTNAAVGREIVNPVSGERIIIRQSGAQTGGKLLAFDLYLPPGGHVPARHAHPAQQETFTVVEGQMRFRLGRRTIIAQPGQTIAIPIGVAHWFGNAGTQVAHARVEVRPALRMQELFETTEALGQASHARGAWLIQLASLARIVLEFQREVAVPDVPAPLVRLALAPLAMLGRRAERAASR
ncbi:MAG TPA: cupin domain-containing protein [Ktedonobacterales bacterium]|nr:cupin domain-containing protein [Ktedonobacterales bacterium]